MLKNLEIPQKIEIVSNGIRSKANVITRSKFSAGDVIYVAEETLKFDKPTYQTVQVSEDIHLLDVVFAHLNHSCRPNTYIECNTQLPSLIAQRDIPIGEELTFFYPSTEWKISSPFKCTCRESSCLREITGALELPSVILNTYRLSNHVKRLMELKSF